MQRGNFTGWMSALVIVVTIVGCIVLYSRLSQQAKLDDKATQKAEQNDQGSQPSEATVVQTRLDAARMAIGEGRIEDARQFLSSILPADRGQEWQSLADRLPK